MIGFKGQGGSDPAENRIAKRRELPFLSHKHAVAYAFLCLDSARHSSRGGAPVARSGRDPREPKAISDAGMIIEFHLTGCDNA